MTDDIVKELRIGHSLKPEWRLLADAADEIDRLRARVKELECATAWWGGTEITYEWFDEIKE